VFVLLKDQYSIQGRECEFVDGAGWQKAAGGRRSTAKRTGVKVRIRHRQGRWKFFMGGILKNFCKRRKRKWIKDFPYVERPTRHTAGMAASMQKQLAQFLRKKRGKMSYPAFARKMGVSPSSLHRMEMAEQNVTLKTLEHLLKRLKCRVTDVFGEPGQ
jgi:DNA-binding Xre family transcriptional regulator